MARKKVKLQWIVNDTARKATYKKRVKGLMKKVKELSILCGVDACAITYSPYHQQPEVWPSPSEVERVLAEFKSRPENDQTKKVLNQENFTWQRITKARDELGKQQKKNRKTEIEHLRTQCLAGKRLDGLTSRDLGDLMWAIDDQLEAVKHKISLVPRSSQVLQQANAATAAAAFTGGNFSGDADAAYVAPIPTGTIDSISGMSLPLTLPLSDVVGNGNGGPPPVVGGSLPFYGINGGINNHDSLGSDSGGGPIQKNSFDLAVEALDNQIMMEQNQQTIHNENNMSNVLGGDQEILPFEYDVSNFWPNPYFH